MSSWKTFVALFFLCISITFGLASLTGVNWVKDQNISAPRFITLQYGLRYWKYSENVGGDPMNRQTSKELTYDGADQELYYRRNFDLVDGSLSSWKSAGSAALALGAIAMSFCFIALLTGLLSLTKALPAIYTAAPTWFAGFCLIFGALLYEGIRPSFHGNQGYEWPMGLYLVAGISADISSFFYYWAQSSTVAAKHSDLSSPTF